MGFLKRLLSLGGLLRRGAILEDYPRGPGSEAEARRFLEERVGAAGPMYWREPWDPESGPAPPYNLATCKFYKGVNRVILSAKRLEDPRWLTGRQARTLGHAPMEGCAGESLWYWQLEERARLRRPDGGLVSGDDGRPLYMSIPLASPVCRRFVSYSVASLEALSGPSLKDYPLKPREIPFDPALVFETLVAATGAEIKIARHSPALYRTGQDAIYLPPAGEFDSQGLYYRTVLHELAHWTGHPGRLSRAGRRLGEGGYAREEMVAEMASFMIAQDLKLPIDAALGDISLSYLNLFAREMEGCSPYFRRVCADAEMARTFLAEKVKDLEEMAWRELTGEPSPLIDERVDPGLESLMMEAMRGEGLDAEGRGRKLEALLVGAYGRDFAQGFLGGLLKESRAAREGVSLYRPPASVPGPGPDSQILGSPSEEEAWDNQDPPLPDAEEGQLASDYFRAIAEETHLRLRRKAAAKILLVIGKMGPVSEIGNKRWLKGQSMVQEFFQEPWAKDLAFSAFLAECQRVCRDTAKKLSYWRTKPPKDPEVRERTIYSAIMLIVEAARKLGYQNLPFGPDQGDYLLAYACVSKRQDGYPGRLKVNGLDIPVVSRTEEGEEIRATIIFGAPKKEGILSIRDPRLAKDLVEALRNPAVPKFNCRGVPEAERLRAGQVKALTEPERPFPKLSDQEGLEMVMRVKKRHEERDLEKRSLEEKSQEEKSLEEKGLEKNSQGPSSSRPGRS
jgi:antirestriction protein ArdC